MASRRMTRKENRRAAVSYVIGQIGSDMFTTAEVWETGRRMLLTGLPWPRGLKNGWKSLRSAQHVGNVLARHPAYERADEGKNSHYIDETRTALWISR